MDRRSDTGAHARRGGRWLRLALLLALAVPEVARAAPADSVVAPRAILIERVAFEGLTRTPAALAESATALALPAPATPEAIAAAVERLRGRGWFRSVAAHTRPGSGPGRVVLVFEVAESRPHLRFGLGHEDFSGWYLIPAQLNADNLTGHGEQLSLGARVGYRVNGLDLALRRPSARSPLDFWQLRARVENVDRIYWLDSTETQHGIARGGVELRAGRRLADALGMEGWLGFDATGVDSNASVYTSRESRDRRKGDAVPFASLPPEIQRDVRDREQVRTGLALTLDRRHGTGLETRGAWSRLSGEGVFSRAGDFASWQADVRGYAPAAPGVQLAARVRAGALSANAPFHERYAVGGLYTVRGYPSQSLSPPQGNLNLGAASLELRTAWWGPAANPRFSGIAFVDAATGWNRTAPTARDIAWGAGFGFRVRVPWLAQAGFDVARPLSDSPVDEAFHINGVLGWTF